MKSHSLIEIYPQANQQSVKRPWKAEKRSRTKYLLWLTFSLNTPQKDPAVRFDNLMYFLQPLSYHHVIQWSLVIANSDISISYFYKLPSYHIIEPITNILNILYIDNMDISIYSSYPNSIAIIKIYVLHCTVCFKLISIYWFHAE